MESKFENSICAYTIDIYTTRKVSPTFLKCSMNIDTWEFEASLKALCIPPLNSTKFDLLLCFSRFVLSTIEWCIAFKYWRCQQSKKQTWWTENHCQKWKGWNLEQQSAHQKSKHASVNNWLFRIKWGFRFRAKGNPKWMKKKLWKSWMKEFEWITQV